MLITKDFVLLNFPKTGSTFTRWVVKTVYPDVQELILPVRLTIRAGTRRGQHGSVSQIPSEYRNRQIVSIARHPFDRYVSLYFFKWFASHPPHDLEVLKKDFPDFPELRFEDFLTMTDRYSKFNILRNFGIDAPTQIGFQTIQFFAFYSYDPASALRSLLEDSSYVTPDFSHITFIHQESLKEDLFQFLLKFDIPADKLFFIQDAKRINASEGRLETNWRSYWDEPLLSQYKLKEARLLEIFPDYA